MRFFPGRTTWMLPRLAACSATLGINHAHCAKSRHADVERFKQEAARTEQLKEAVAWCKENNKKGYPASHRMDDQGNWYWPLVTEGSCNRRLAGAVDVDHPFSSRAVLTPEEEHDLVETCKELNKHAQGVDREQLGKMVYDSLLLRAELNAGRDSTPLSREHTSLDVCAGLDGSLYDAHLIFKGEYIQRQMIPYKPIERNPAKDRRRIQGSWGDMDQNEMLEKFDEQADEEEVTRVTLEAKRAAAEERKRERDVLAEEKKEAKSTALELEQPITALLKQLGFTDGASAQVTASELTIFARANRVQLVEIGVDLSSLTRQSVMPQLQSKLGGTTSRPSILWEKAALKALPAPKEAAPAAGPSSDGLLALCEPVLQPLMPSVEDEAAPVPAKKQRVSRHATNAK